jgi:hypothetical protein
MTIDGVMAIVKASRKTIRVLELSPQSQNSFVHSHPGTLGGHEDSCSAQKRQMLYNNCCSMLVVSYVELFFADRIFEPDYRLVHGDFSLAQISSAEYASER